MNQISNISELIEAPDALAGLTARAAVYATQSSGEGTRRAYASAWRGYTAWCTSMGLEPLNGDPRTLGLYVTARAEDLCASSIGVALSAIRAAHRLAGVPIDMEDQRLSMVVEGVRRNLGVRPQRKATAATPDVLRRLLAGMPPHTSPIGARNRAMLMLQFGAAMRRSEVAALKIRDVVVEPGRGLIVLIRRSKTDQLAEGREIAVAENQLDPEFCPAIALSRWMEHRGTTDPDAPLFCAIVKSGRVTGEGLTDKAVVRMIKLAAEGAGLDPDLFSGHSPRRGFMTTAAQAGVSLGPLMKHSRHTTTEIALGYIENAELWKDNVSTRVWNG